MCRLLGTVSRAPVTLDDVLGHERDAFLALARQHGDGWGHAWSATDGAPLELRKSPGSALESSELATLTAGRPASAALTHLRWATLGLAVREANTHPFSDGVVAFAHNGSIDPPGVLDALIAPEIRPRMLGDTDSERYFLAVLSRLAEGASATEALVGTVRDVRAGGARVHSLNALLLTPTELLAVCCYDPASHSDEDYYPLIHRRAGDTYVVASTGWTDSAGWSVLGNNEVLAVERATLRPTVVDIGAEDPLRAAS